MDYYKLFNLEKEPFSNTPDPEFFFRSTRHAECLQKLEIAIRLRRGLCIVRGEVGTGKTTLCRQLVRTLSDDENVSVYMVLDPGFDRTEDFAATVSQMLAGRDKALRCTTVAEHKELIKNHLFETGVDNGKTTVLIIDEGQKLPGGCIEFLRELLNYETNDEKLLQIVIFAQNEIDDLLSAHPNFADRAALYHHLKPLDRKETSRLIQYRLNTAGSSHKNSSAPKFTRRAAARIYRLSRGYPRKIINLCHHVLLLLLVRGQSRVTPAIVNRAASSLPGVIKTPSPGLKRRKAAGVSAAAVLFALIAAAAYSQWPALSSTKQNPDNLKIEKSVSAEPVTANPEPEPEPETPPKAETIETAAKPNRQAAEMPSVLGWARINKNEILWNMLRRIYGSGSEKIVEKVKMANPGLTDPNLIRAGRKINFPVLGESSVPRQQHYWIACQKSASLNLIYQFVHARKSRDLRVLSFWGPSGGLQHAAVYRSSYSEYQDARQALENKNGILSETAVILDLSKDGMRLLTKVGKS